MEGKWDISNEVANNIRQLCPAVAQRLAYTYCQRIATILTRACRIRPIYQLMCQRITKSLEGYSTFCSINVATMFAERKPCEIPQINFIF